MHMSLWGPEPVQTPTGCHWASVPLPNGAMLNESLLCTFHYGLPLYVAYGGWVGQAQLVRV